MSDQPLRVTLVGINFAPEETGIAPYTTGVARGLAERGHAVHVVTTYPHYPQWKVRAGYTGWRRHDTGSGLSVRRVRHYVPGEPTGFRRALSEVSFGLQAITTRWKQPDVVLFISPALLSTSLGIVRARRGTAAVGIVIQDLYSVGHAETSGGDGPVATALGRIERWAARRADGVAVIHDRFKRRVSASLGVDGESISVIRNWTHVPPSPTVERSLARETLNWGTSTVVLHAGAMGEKQALGNVVEAAREAERRGLDMLFVLLGDGGQRIRLEQQASGLANIRFLDPLPGELYGQAMRSADVLLVNEKPGVVEMAVPSKLTSYFSTGVPVLAATDPHSTTAEEIVASGAGALTLPGDPAGLVDAVQELCADHNLASSIGARGPAYCAKVLSERAAIDGYEDWLYELVARAEWKNGER